MVDASLRMSIVNLFKDLKDKYGVSIIYITHDLATAYYISDYIAIMLRGQIIERGDVENVLMRPLHPYSQLLKESILQPVPNKRRKGRARKASFEVEEFNLPGCKFTERCSFAEDICRRENPKEYYVEGRTVRCFLYEGEESSP
jgi:peptide/nickel transport system ATP-binding protein